MRLSGYSYVIGRGEAEGDFKDVRIKSTSEGFNAVEIARDPNDTTRKFYVVERRLLPGGSWYRLMDVSSFNPDADTDDLSETRAEITYEEFTQDWNISIERTYGLSSGMESPWTEPLEMVGNELLLPMEAEWVSGDGPTNVFIGDKFSNGRYEVQIANGRVTWSVKGSGRVLGSIKTDTGTFIKAEGIAGAARFRGGQVFVEPAKPALFIGEFLLESVPEYISPGLYRYGDGYLISTRRITGLRGAGAICMLDDPSPDRWVPRMMGRAYVELTSPSSSPPLFEEEPRRVSVEIVYPPNDFPDITPVAVTAYANKTGVFNAWDLDTDKVDASPKERPWDILMPFEARIEDWGGFPAESEEEYRPAQDYQGLDKAAFPNEFGYTLEGVPAIPRGSLFLRWKDSEYFRIIRNQDLNVAYRRGYVYFRSESSPEANGIANIRPAMPTEWQKTKIEWDHKKLHVNELPGLTEERSWQELTHDDGERMKWGQITNQPMDRWRPDPDVPLSVEQYEELQPTWVTGQTEEEGPPLKLWYHKLPRTWGRLLYEEFDDSLVEIKANDMTIFMSELVDMQMKELK